MSKNSNRPGNGNGRGEFPVFAGILLGIVMGLALAATIAWFVLKKNPMPVPPAKEAPVAAKPAVAPEKSANTKPAVSGTASANNEGKTPPRFEFYKELTDKPDSSASKKAERHEHDSAMLKQVTPAKPATSNATYFLQEGAYSNMDDAEKVKAKLALLGMVASIQPANIPDKGVWYRVRLGPYKNSAEMNEALASLKLNGLKAAPIKAQ
jgi:cell division protein FtsN